MGNITGHHHEIGHGHHGHDHGEGHTANNHNLQVAGKAMQSNYALSQRTEPDRVLQVLRFLSPMSIAIFCFAFGIIGYLTLRLVP